MTVVTTEVELPNSRRKYPEHLPGYIAYISLLLCQSLCLISQFRSRGSEKLRNILKSHRKTNCHTDLGKTHTLSFSQMPIRKMSRQTEGTSSLLSFLVTSFLGQVHCANPLLMHFLPLLGLDICASKERELEPLYMGLSSPSKSEPLGYICVDVYTHLYYNIYVRMHIYV